MGYDEDLPAEAREAIEAANVAIRGQEAETATHVARVEQEARAEVQRIKDGLAARVRERRRELAALLKPMQEARMRAGELDAALAIREHVRALHAQSSEAQPAPVNLVAHAADGPGKTLTFDVIGAATGPVWGTDVYTLDTYLAVAAVHAGAVQVGQRAIVRVTLIDTAGQTFTGTLRNGISSFNWAAYPIGYRFVR